MKYIKLYEEFSGHHVTQVQRDFLNKYVDGSWIFNSEGKVIVKGNVNIYGFRSKETRKLPISFKEVSGDFMFIGMDLLETLEGAPAKVGGNFMVQSCNSLSSLKGSPEEVHGSYSCMHLGLIEDLEGTPIRVGRDFVVSNCKSLESLKGSPKTVERTYHCSHNGGLKTLQYISPEVRGSVEVSSCYGVPREELDLLDRDKDLFLKWANSTTKIGDFLQQKRGTLKGKVFGF